MDDGVLGDRPVSAANPVPTDEEVYRAPESGCREKESEDEIPWRCQHRSILLLQYVEII